MPIVSIGALCYGTRVIQSSKIGLQEFSNYVELYINFNTRVRQDTLSVTTGTFDALEEAVEMFADVPSITEKIAIVLTDGNSDNIGETRNVSFFYAFRLTF